MTLLKSLYLPLSIMYLFNIVIFFRLLNGKKVRSLNFCEPALLPQVDEIHLIKVLRQVLTENCTENCT